MSERPQDSAWISEGDIFRHDIMQQMTEATRGNNSASRCMYRFRNESYKTGILTEEGYPEDFAYDVRHMWEERMQKKLRAESGAGRSSGHHHHDAGGSHVGPAPKRQRLMANGNAAPTMADHPSFGINSMMGAHAATASAIGRGELLPSGDGGTTATRRQDTVVRDLMSEELDSGDDVTDEETEATTAPVAYSNVLLCQFNKVGRGKSKSWRLDLKDGVLQLDSKAEVPFHEIKGEAECESHSKCIRKQLANCQSQFTLKLFLSRLNLSV